MKKATLTLLIIIAAAGAAPSQTEEGHRTLLFDLRSDSCPAEAGKRVNRRLRAALAGLPNLELVGNGGGRCRTGVCAVEAARRAGAHRAVYGTIAVSTSVTKKRLGDSGVERYIIKVDSRDTYRLTVTLMDAGTGAALTTLTRACKPERLDNTVDALAASLAAYYGPREVSEKEKNIAEKPQPAGEDRGDSKAEPVKPGEQQKAPKEPVRFDAALYFSFMVPAGSFSRIASFSFGNIIEGRARNLIVNNTELRLAAGYYYVSVPAGDVKSYRAFYGAVSAGYRFEVFKNLYLTPLLGAGCQVHFLTNSNYNGGRTYADPLMTIRLGLDYRLYKGLHLAVVPGYAVLFEKRKTGMYPSIDIGLCYSF